MIQLNYYKEIIRWRSLGRMATQHGAKWALTFEDWIVILWKSRGKCYFCRWALPDSGSFIMEHIYPLSQGGAHSILNVVAACQQCNTIKANLTADRWLLEVSNPYRSNRAYLQARVASVVRHRRYQLDINVNDAFAPGVKRGGGPRSYEVWRNSERLEGGMTLYQATTQYLWYAGYMSEWKEAVYVKDKNGNVVASLERKRLSLNRMAFPRSMWPTFLG